MVQHKIYPNGLKLIVKRIDGLLSVTAGIMVGAGSVDEQEENNGISHFIEHMLFKGTKKRSAFEISDSMDRIGAQINAFTTKELTCYYAKSTAEHFPKSLEILSDIFFNSLFEEKEMDKEKGVILEEIAMSGDTPDDLCMDMLAKAFYGDDNLGRPILGSGQNVQAFDRAAIDKYMKANYRADNITVSVAGNVDFELARKLVEQYFLPFFPAQTAAANTVLETEFATRADHLFAAKDIEQLHIGLAFPSIKLDDPSSSALAIVNIVLGGGMSSRLFQKIREELGLAYTVYSYQSSYKNSGFMTLYAGINPKNKQVALNALKDELERFKKDGLTPDEFARGKEQIKSTFVLGQESTSAQMMLYGKYFLQTGKVFNFNNKIKEISDVTSEEAFAAIKSGYDDRFMASACVGKDAEALF